MTPLPDLYTYQDPEVLTPPDDACDWCGESLCGPGCRPPVTGRSMARYLPRIENGDPES